MNKIATAMDDDPRGRNKIDELLSEIQKWNGIPLEETRQELLARLDRLENLLAQLQCVIQGESHTIKESDEEWRRKLSARLEAIEAAALKNEIATHPRELSVKEFARASEISEWYARFLCRSGALKSRHSARMSGDKPMWLIDSSEVERIRREGGGGKLKGTDGASADPELPRDVVHRQARKPPSPN